MASRDEVMAALSAVPGPDGRTALPDSGAVSGLTIRDGKVFLAIVVDPATAQDDGGDAREGRSRDQGACPA